VVGVGGIASTWLPILAASELTDVAAAVDVAPAAAEARLAEHGIDAPVFAELDAALASVAPDVVVSLTPPDVHRAVAEVALAAGCHVVTEKPLATTLADGRAIVAAAERAARTCAVMQNRRFEHGIRTTRDGIAEGRIGPITTVCCDFLLAPRFGGFREEMEAPLLADMAIHHFDQARFLTGAEAVAVSCRSFNPEGSRFAGDAAAVALVELDDGSVFSYRGSWAAPGLGTSWNGDWRVIGTRGTAAWDGEGDPVADVLSSDDDGEMLPPVERSTWPRTWAGRTSHAGCFDDIFGALAAGRRAETDCADNVKSLALTIAAIESARRGGERIELAGLAESAA
jgi:predicted dehydrogenase